MNNITVNAANNTIELSKKFAKAACQYGTEEYRMLQEVRRDYPGFEVVQAAKKAKAAKDPYKKLNFEFMEKYIKAHDNEEKSIMKQYLDLRALSDEAIENGACTNSMASGWAPIASHQINVTLQPNETKTFIFVLGYIENPEDDKWESYGIINKKPAFEMLEKYNTDAGVEKAFAELQDYWQKLLAKYNVQSGNDKVNRMVNIWNQYQCMVTFNMSRSASYYESGIGRGMGFRDSCQDLLGFVHLIPDRARERIIDIASTQFQDGSAYHQYQPLTKKGNSDIGSGFNDDPLWLIAGTSAYVRETGDTSILTEMVPFDNDMSVATPLMNHLKRSFDYTVNHKGPHGLPLIGRADWNDCLNLNCFSNTPGESFQTTANFESGVAESLFIAGMFCGVCEDYEKLCRLYGWEEEADAVKGHMPYRAFGAPFA